MRHFPKDKDPNNPTDLLDRPLDVGDYVAWPTQSGSAASSITVGRIVRINFTRPRVRHSNGEPYESSGEYSEARPTDATRYTVTAQPIKYTGYYSDTEYDDTRPEGERLVKVPVKPVTIQNVANLVKVEVPEREIHVWSEHGGKGAALDAGYTDGHTIGICHGSARAATLQEAADKVFALNSMFADAPEFNPNYDREKMTYWGCSLFERKPRYA